jgi:predicted RNase H-like HicB family nuclease
LRWIGSVEQSEGEVEVATGVLTAVLHQETDLFVAECPEVGTVSQGYTMQEALASLKEATELYLEDFPPPVEGDQKHA